MALPVVTKVTPDHGPAGMPVVLTGTDLTGATAVVFEDTPVLFTVNSATQITVTAAPNVNPGQPLRVFVTTPGGTNLVTKPASTNVTYKGIVAVSSAGAVTPAFGLDTTTVQVVDKGVSFKTFTNTTWSFPSWFPWGAELSVLKTS